MDEISHSTKRRLSGAPSSLFRHYPILCPMSIAKHVEMLQRGPAAWNHWRQSNPGIYPDLIGTDFTGASLKGVIFSDTSLNGVVLDGADLRDASFVRAIALFAQLNGTNLTAANLALANLTGARLHRSDLSGCNLNMTNLSFADLSGSNLDGALFEATILGHTDLSDARGLENCVHVNASFLGHQTLELSGKLPPVFMRGCGLPEEWIRSAPNLARGFHSCFISYASQDQPFVERLHKSLQHKGVRCWYAPKDLPIGDHIRLGIDESIRRHDRVLIVLSAHSVESPWVEKEVATATEEERKQKRTILFPIRVELGGRCSQIKEHRRL